MKKPKKLTPKKLAELQAKYDELRGRIRAFVMPIYSIANRRTLMEITPSNEKGLINGLTIPELIMLVNLNNGTGESTHLESDGKKLYVIAKKSLPSTPYEFF